MLVLTRCPTESILIGEDIEVTVLEVGNGRVRLRVASSRLDPPVREETLLFCSQAGVISTQPLRLSSSRRTSTEPKIL
jgi:carbon storage regulator CsrA